MTADNQWQFHVKGQSLDIYVLDFNVEFLFIHVLLVYKFNFHLRFQFGLIKYDESHDETCIFTRSVL